MSDIEEVVITKSSTGSKQVKDTKPEIARQKMKEKRERLKKEKEDSMINEAKNRLAQDLEKKKLEEEKKKQEEEEKLKADPIYQIRMMLEKLTSAQTPAPVAKKVTKKKVEEPVYVEEEKPKKRVVKKKVEEVVVPPVPTPIPKTPKPRAPRKKVESPTTQFYGTAPTPEPQEVYYAPTFTDRQGQNPLLERMANRRRMGSYY